jgi:hypothetical protein
VQFSIKTLVLSEKFRNICEVLFPVELWNHYENDKRSNNDLEGYNEKSFKKHPNIWIFINKLCTQL